MSSCQRYVAFIVGSLFYAFVTLTRNLPVIVSEVLCQKFQMSEIVFGQYRGLYYVGYCLAHLPMAYALDRFGPRSIITISILMCVVGLLPMLWSDSAAVLIAGRVLLGIGASTGILGVFKINRTFFEPKQFAFLLGITGMAGYATSVVGLGPLKRIFSAAGYETTLMGILGVGLVLALAAFICICPTQEQIPGGFVKSIKQLSKNSSFWIVSLVGGLIIWSMEGFADGWSVPLLTSLFNYDSTKAVDITSVIPIGFAVGSIILPLLVARFNNSKQIFGLAGLFSSAALAGLFIPGISAEMVLVFYMVLGGFSAYQVLCIDWGGKIVVPELSTLSSASTNMLIMSFGYLFHTASAFLMNNKGVEDAVTNVVYYSRTDLLMGLSPFIVSGVIAYIINTCATYDRNNG